MESMISFHGASSIGASTAAMLSTGSGTSSTIRNIFPEITIQVEGTQVIPAQSIKLDMQSASMGIGGTLLLTATLDPLDATDEILWSSSNETVATVEGFVTLDDHGLAALLEKLGRDAEAQPLWKRTLELHPEAVDPSGRPVRGLVR